MTRLFLAISLLIATMSGWAQTEAQFAIQMDISPYLFKGFSIKGIRYPASFNGHSIGAEVFAMDLPDAYFKKDNPDWTGRVQFGADVTVDFHFGKAEKGGWFAGPAVVYLAHRMQDQEAVTNFETLELGGKISYRWFPKGDHFFVEPYILGGYRMQLSEPGFDYQPKSGTMLGSLFVGWRF